MSPADPRPADSQAPQTPGGWARPDVYAIGVIGYRPATAGALASALRRVPS
jgi:hypothetical protein